MRIKTGDNVIVISGKDKGKTGSVIETFPKTDKVKVEGIAIVKKHMKPTQENQDGGIEEMEAAIPVSNVMILDPKSNKPTKVGYRLEDGKKVRYAKSSGTNLS